MSMEEITAAVKQRLMDLSGLGYCVRFDFGDEGSVTIDGRATPPTIADDATEADTVIRLSPENGLKLLEGSLNPTLAYTMGKLKIEGSMGVALKVASMLEE
jgi:putative sterol carrier protein